ncbi:hypothetical protein SRHO_G00111390 [Serrasalmus rhombeus]
MDQGITVDIKRSRPSSQTYVQETFINATSAATASQDGNELISVLEKEKEGWRGCSAEPKRSTVIHRVPVHSQYRTPASAQQFQSWPKFRPGIYMW